MTSSDTIHARDVLLFGEPESFFVPLYELKLGNTPLEPILLAFIQNLSSALQVGNIPFLLSQSAILDQRLNQLIIAERIRARTNIDNGMSEGEAELLADRTALSRLREEHRDHERVEEFADSTLRVLNRHLNHGDFYHSAQELLRQIVVMCWASFEILINDTLRSLLNTQPSLIRAIASHRYYKDVLSSSALIEALDARKYDLSNSIGDLVCENVKLDSLERIREAVRLTICDSGLDQLLKDDSLWLLSQQRHLIVHRRAVVDLRYQQRTGDDTQVGHRLTFSPSYVENSLMLVRDLGCAVLRSVVAKLSPPSTP